MHVSHLLSSKYLGRTVVRISEIGSYRTVWLKRVKGPTHLAAPALSPKHVQEALEVKISRCSLPTANQYPCNKSLGGLLESEI